MEILPDVVEWRQTRKGLMDEKRFATVDAMLRATDPALADGVVCLHAERAANRAKVLGSLLKRGWPATIEWDGDVGRYVAHIADPAPGVCWEVVEYGDTPEDALAALGEAATEESQVEKKMAMPLPQFKAGQRVNITGGQPSEEYVREMRDG